MRDNLLRLKSKALSLRGTNEAVLKPIPQGWADFARLTKIRSGAALVPFDPYQYQIDVSNAIDSHTTTVIGKTRQLGLSEMIVSKFVHKALLNGNYLAVVLSRTQSDTANLAKRARKQIESYSRIR